MPLDFKKLDEYIGKDARVELNNEGFPDYMIYSFIQTAQETKTIISSRLPGPAGPDLIQEGYDLKGFQIKAKSCDWGPMGGFICQLPFFNKYGFPKVDYNTGYIAHYLKNLANFSGSGKKIAEKNTARQKKIDELDVKDPQYKSQKYNIDKIYDKQILEELTAYRGKEQVSGEWAGENSQPTDGQAPFVQLKRKFAGDTRSIVADLAAKDNLSVSIIGNQIYGIAVNDTYDTDPAKNKATVFAEFLLIREKDILKPGEFTDIWGIYHGRIMYKKTTNDPAFTEFKSAGYSTVVGSDVKKDYPFEGTGSVTDANKILLEKIFSFASFPASISITITPKGPFNFEAGEQKFYPMQGFMNPHPPYPKDSPDFYKNAVSGDYDLFAFWPNIPAVNVHDLTRISELKIGKQLRLGGKILTTFIGDNADLGIEFIPGFKELNPAKDKDKKIIPGEELKESAELGNISSLGQLVSGTLNAIAGAVCLKEYSTALNANKAFHSDEGGRPGVMEIEFPIAVFFPGKFATLALNNLYDPAEPGKKIIPKFVDRKETQTYGGLIKTAEEFLQLIFECQEASGTFQKPTNSINGKPVVITPGEDTFLAEKNYLVMMHSEWMMHLFFMSMPDEARKDFVNQGELFKRIVTAPNSTDDDKKKVADKIDEFKKIEKHKNENFNQAAFEESLKKLVLAQAGVGNNNSEDINLNHFFKELRELFLRMAFESSRKAYSKRLEVEALLTKYHRLYAGYPN